MEDRKESIKKALLTIKKECSRYDECEMEMQSIGITA